MLICKECESLLRQGSPLNETDRDGNSPLIHAIGYRPIASLLLAEMNKRDQLHLVDQRNAQEETALIVKAKNFQTLDDQDTVYDLLQSGASEDAQDKQNNSFNSLRQGNLRLEFPCIKHWVDKKKNAVIDPEE